MYRPRSSPDWSPSNGDREEFNSAFEEKQAELRQGFTDGEYPEWESLSPAALVWKIDETARELAYDEVGIMFDKEGVLQ